MMAKKIKSLRDIIANRAGRNVPKGEEDFLSKHEVSVKEDPAGNKDDIFNATNITPEQESQKADPGKRHGYREGEDVKAYEETIHEKGMECNKSSAKIYCPVHGKEECSSEKNKEVEDKSLDEAETKFVIKHKKTRQVLSTHSKYDDAKDEHNGISKDRDDYGIFKQTKKDAALANRNTMREETIDEVLTAKDSASEWISDFVKSDNPKFAGKSKKERIKQALAAYYAKKRGN